MALLRIIAENVLNRAVLTASTTAGLLVVANLLTDVKSDVWRSTGTSATLTATWAAPEAVSGWVHPICNFSPTTTIRVRGYSDAAGTAQLFDTGAMLACPAPAIKLRGWSAAQAASAYAYGGGACARVWFGSSWTVQRLVVDIVDTANLQGYLEAARAVTGLVWSPSRTISDAPWTMADMSTHYRTDAGDLLTDAGTMHKKLPINFGRLLPVDRAALANILRSSRAHPIFVSVFPGIADLELERDYTIYGKRSQDSEIAIQYAIAYSTTVELEEI
jgi:hypothetical protein